MDAPIRVLLIEDDPAYPVLLERLFASVPGLILCGVAQDGRLGLELLEQEQVDVVLLDLVMPEMDGLTFLERLRNRPGRPAVVVLSGVSSQRIIQRALGLGADYYLIKPVEPRALLGLLRTLCGGAVEECARTVLEEMGAGGLGMAAACAAAAELARERDGQMLLKEAYAPLIQRERTSYACVEKNIRALTGKLHAGGSPAYRQLMGGMPSCRPSNGEFLRCLCRAALARCMERRLRPKGTGGSRSSD